MLLMSPQNPCTWARAHPIISYFFPLASSSLWQVNYHVQQYPDMQIENCTQQRASFFWQGGVSWDVCVGRGFLSLSLHLSLFHLLFFSELWVGTLVSVSWREWGRGPERHFWEISEMGAILPTIKQITQYISITLFTTVSRGDTEEHGCRVRRGNQPKRLWFWFHRVERWPLEGANRFMSTSRLFIDLPMWGQRCPISTNNTALRYISDSSMCSTLTVVHHISWYVQEKHSVLKVWFVQINPKVHSLWCGENSGPTENNGVGSLATEGFAYIVKANTLSSK